MTPAKALFFLLVWFVPFALFVSLSVNDNVLPSMSMSSGSLSYSGSSSLGKQQQQQQQ